MIYRYVVRELRNVSPRDLELMLNAMTNDGSRVVQAERNRLDEWTVILEYADATADAKELPHIPKPGPGRIQV